MVLKNVIPDTIPTKKIMKTQIVMQMYSVMSNLMELMVKNVLGVLKHITQMIQKKITLMNV